MTEQEQQFINAWRTAAPELRRLRNEKLANLDDSAGLNLLGANASSTPGMHGMAVMQSWFLRLRAKQLTAKIQTLEARHG